MFRGRSLFISWGGGLGNILRNPSFLPRPPPPHCQIFISQSTPPPQQQTVYNADPRLPPVAPPYGSANKSLHLKFQNGFQNVIKHEINKKKDETMIIKKGKKIDILFSKIVKSVINFPKHTCSEISKHDSG